MEKKLSNNIVAIICFFSFSGYYLGLSFFFILNKISFTRFYSIPLRIVLIALMLYGIYKNIDRIKHKYTVPAFLLFSMIYIFKTVYTEFIGFEMSSPWFEYVFYYFSYSFFPFFFFSTINFKKYKNIIIDTLIFSGFILGVASIYMFKEVLITGGIGRISLLTYETGDSIISPLALAYSGSLTIALCLYKLIYEVNTRFYTTYLFITMVISFILFFLGSTRGALIAILLCVLVFIYFGSVQNKLRAFLYFILSIPLIIYGVQKTGSSIFERSMSTIETGDSSGREPLWNDAINEFTKHPIFGGRIEVSGIYPHNLFIEILMATGVIGFLIFMVFFAGSVKKGFVAAKSDTIYIIPFLIFICGLSQHMFTGALWSAIMFFSALGMFNSFSNYSQQ